MSEQEPNYLVEEEADEKLRRKLPNLQKRLKKVLLGKPEFRRALAEAFLEDGDVDSVEFFRGNEMHEVNVHWGSISVSVQDRFEAEANRKKMILGAHRVDSYVLSDAELCTRVNEENQNNNDLAVERMRNYIDLLRVKKRKFNE